MHAARLDKSRRLKRVLNVLSDGAEHSTLDIVRQARVCAVNSIVAELRHNGFSIACQRRGEYWYYRLESKQ